MTGECEYCHIVDSTPRIQLEKAQSSALSSTPDKLVLSSHSEFQCSILMKTIMKGILLLYTLLYLEIAKIGIIFRI